MCSNLRFKCHVKTFQTLLQGTMKSEEDQEGQYVADLLGVADEKIHKLQMDICKMKDGKEATERRNKSLHKQVCYQRNIYRTCEMFIFHLKSVLAIEFLFKY